MSSSSSSAPTAHEELRWVINIRRCMEEDLEDDDENPICIFDVPRSLLHTSPYSYIPQKLSLGPYHCCRQELFEMERYKLSATKRVRKQLQNLKFDELLHQFINLEPKIRGCYNKYINFDGETIAWMMMLDASFLIEFLEIYAFNESTSKPTTPTTPTPTPTPTPSRKCHLLDYSKRNCVHSNEILRDIIMLENQIPMFILLKLQEFQFSSSDESLVSTLMGLYKHVSPFRTHDLMQFKVSEYAHLLDFIYNVIMEESVEVVVDREVHSHSLSIKQDQESSIDSTFMKRRRFMKNLLQSKPVRLLDKLPWKSLTNIPGFALLKKAAQVLLFYSNQTSFTVRSSILNNNVNPPLVEEIAIPSVTELSNSGVRFVPTRGNISTINFDTKTATFYLPTISLDVNSEVILRNLVAYEASVASGPIVLTRYTELMNGIIDTKEDVQILREKGIILNHMNSDIEVANMWNGMNKSIRLTRVPFMDKVIEDVNRYYDSTWKVKARKYMKNYVFGSWKILTLLAAILLLLMTALDAVCSVGECSRVFHIKTPES